MRLILSTIFIILFIVNYVVAISVESLEDYIRANTSITNFSFKDSKQKTVKLVTFSDSDMKIRFILYTDIASNPDAFVVPAKIEDSDNLIAVGCYKSGADLSDAYNTLPTRLKEEFNLDSDDCFGIDKEKQDKCVRQCGGEVINGERNYREDPNCYLDCSYRTGVFKKERPEKCIRAAIIKELVRSNRYNEFGKEEFLNRMMKMDFKIEKIVVEDNYFDAPGTGNTGYVPYGIRVYTLNGKPIALVVLAMIID